MSHSFSFFAGGSATVCELVVLKRHVKKEEREPTFAVDSREAPENGLRTATAKMYGSHS